MVSSVERRASLAAETVEEGLAGVQPPPVGEGMVTGLRMAEVCGAKHYSRGSNSWSRVVESENAEGDARNAKQERQRTRSESAQQIEGGRGLVVRLHQPGWVGHSSLTAGFRAIDYVPPAQQKQKLSVSSCARISATFLKAAKQG